MDYTLDGAGRLTVHNETGPLYRYIDFTAQTVALFNFLSQTIDRQLKPELAFLVRYDAAKTAIQRIVDLPDQRIDRFIRFCLQNQGQVSQRKRESHFAMLSDAEVAAMAQAVRTAWRADLRPVRP